MHEFKPMNLEDIAYIDVEQLKGSTEANFAFFYIDISSVSTNKVDFPVHAVTFREAPSRARKLLRDHDILLSTVRPNLKAFAVFRQPDSAQTYVASTGFAIIRQKEGYDISFIFQCLLSEFVGKQMEALAVGSNYPALNSRDIRKLKIRTPLLPTQQKIARILSTLDGVIARTEAVVAKYTALKAGLLQDLFTRGIDANGNLRPSSHDAPDRYKPSALGLIPKEWDVERIEDVCDYVDYRGKTPPKTESGVFLITARNIKFGFIDYETSKEYIPEYAFESTMSRGKAEIGDVVITTEAPMGNVAQIDREDVALAQRVIKYRGIRGLVNNDYLKTYFLTEIFQKQLEAESTGSTVKGIKGSRLHKLFVLRPCFNEQKEIAYRLQEVDSIVQTEQTYLTKLQGIRAGLMTDLLNGDLDLSTIILADVAPVGANCQ